MAEQNKIDDGGPAFPSMGIETDLLSHGEKPYSHTYSFDEASGMSLRDYFAAKAMNGLLAAEHDDNERSVKAIVQISYAIADAMLKARKAPQ